MTKPRSPFVMSHVDLQAAVVEILHLCGWKHLHVRRSIGKGRQWQTTTNVKGWPDVLAWSPRQPGRHLAIEIKVPPDDLHDDQREVLVELAASGFEVWVLTEEWLQRFGSAIARPSITRQGETTTLGSTP